MLQSLAENQRAHYDYEILETLEAGIELFGLEVKAIRAGRMSLRGSFATLRQAQGKRSGAEMFLTNANIAPYQPSNTPAGYDPTRPRRLLLKRSEVNSLIGKIRTQGLTAVPLKVYDKEGRIKVLVGIARGKKKYDKRASIRKRETEREIRRATKQG